MEGSVDMVIGQWVYRARSRISGFPGAKSARIAYRPMQLV